MRRADKALGTPGARLPIRWRLALMSFGLLALLLGALGAVVSVTEENALLANRAVELHREAWLAATPMNQTVYSFAYAGQTVSPRAKTPPPQAKPVLTALGQRLTNPGTRVCIIWIDGAQQVIGPVPEPDMAPVDPPARVTLAGALTSQAFRSVPATDWYTVAPDAEGQSQLVVLLPIVDQANHDTIALLQVGTPTAPMMEAVTTTRLVLAAGIAIALLIAAAVTFPLMGAGLRPLVEMERASGRIAAGALSLRLAEPPARDEIGRLARSFNSMVAQLEDAFTRQKRFVADVSHELRTPLTALGGGLEMLLLGADRGDTEAARRLTRGMYAEVDRMRRLVEDLLTLTRLDDGQAGLRADLVAVASIVAEVCEQAQRLARGQTVRCDVEAGLLPIRADADRLRQVLLNLLDNALKHTPTTGTITITARREGATTVALAVRDTGRGIPAEALPHVFDRFYRTDPARARSGERTGGAGLGLSIARGLVEAQGGQIAIESATGRGTTVTLRFPIAAAGTEQSAQPAPVLSATTAPLTGNVPSPAEPPVPVE
ncbi:MAG TPA: HAMP domain-containing sensor histidine kinase [Ktedonobacterales bacterium]|nr:HAMP domain-containing sensor histidine kinase [Ktedonobacterales bacterium]